MVADCAISGNRNLAVTALNMNPLCPSDAIANVVIDEDTGEVLEPKADLDDFPEPNEQDI